MLIDLGRVEGCGRDGRMRMMFGMLSADRFNAVSIVDSFDDWTARWHLDPGFSVEDVDALNQKIQHLHRANFELWHQEDKARDVHATDAVIAASKRAIDRINQHRNDQMERCDTLLLEVLAAKNLPNPQAELHSETPGLMLDRLSILTLKRYHTREEMNRAAAPEGHRERNRERLGIIEKQRNDLAACLDRLWQLVLREERQFQLYRQLKMYNDADLNPVLYERSKA